MEVTKGAKMYYARALPSCGIFDVEDLVVRTAEDTWFVGVEEKTKRAYIFNNKDINKDVFFVRKEAVDVVNEAEANCKKKISDETYYEEY